MNEASSIRRSACPGLYRLAPARDGGICRVKPALGVLDAEAARALAAAARDLGNGIIEITSRANLQLRGIDSRDASALAARLDAAGLGVPDPAADDVRNVIVAPSHGLDSCGLLDTAPIARAILAHLAADPACHVLSPKFSILLDGGESTAPLDHPNDIVLCAIDPARFALVLGGSASDAPLGWVFVADAPVVVATLIARFLAASGPGITRIRHLGPQAAALAQGLVQPLDGWHRPRPPAMAHIGAFPEAVSARFWVGARPPLGRLDPKMLEDLADLAVAAGNGTLRLTPFQSVLLPAIADPVAVLARLKSLGLAIAAGEPLADLLACAGSTGCRSALADSQADALVLAAAGVGQGLHVTACEKSCAAARPAAHTLVAVAPGRYDLYRKAEGAASRFGERIASALTPAAAARRLGKA